MASERSNGSVGSSADHYESIGVLNQALRYTQSQLDLEPYQEEIHRRLMRLLAISGRRSEAIAHYESCRQILSEELGVEPSEETIAIYERIQSGELKRHAIELRGRFIRGYELRQPLGAGHFGAVYRAYQPVVGRDVAIKVILPHHANQPDFIRRFEVEAQVIARLEHPHIVPLYDYWRDPDGAYLVMRWLRAGSLQSALERGPWKTEKAIKLVDQIASALAFAHRQNVVHRDIKPANILLDEDDNAYLSDFGIAIITEPIDSPSADQALGLMDETTGSLGYLSPEVAQGGVPTLLVDIYSFGVILYELLTGEHPFPDIQGEELLKRHLHNPLPSAHTLRPDLPSAADEVIQQATAKDPAERYPDALSLAQAFHQAFTPDPSVTIKAHVAGIEIQNPYKGLRSFQEADVADFFGRESLVRHLLTRMGEVSENCRFLAVVGPSGSGKSSIVKAGLIPALRQGSLPGSENWFIVEMTPRAHPIEELETALLRISVNPPESLLGQLQEDERGLLRAVRRSIPDDESELLLIIDQFDELFTLVKGETERKQFLESLYTAVTDPHSRLRVVITLRADFYDRPLMYPQFGDLVRTRMETVMPLSLDELERAITGPAERVSAMLEAGLVSAIVGDVSDQPGALPLLQYALTELFERRQENILTKKAYQDSGGVLGALARRAEALYEGLDEIAKQATRQLFLRLVTLGEGTEDTRRRVIKAELTGLPDYASGEINTMERVIDAFGRYRLLTFDHDQETRAPTMEVAHEALLREWKRLRDWIEVGREDLRNHRSLTTAADEWIKANRDPSFLLRGKRLNLFESWVEDTDLALTQTERDFLDTSLSERQADEAAEAARQARERALERRSRNFLRVLVIVLALATVIAMGLVRIAHQAQIVAEEEAQGRATQQAIAQHNADESLGLALASSARLALSAGDTDLAIALAMEAIKIEDPLPQVQLTLADVAYAPGTIMRLDGHSNRVYSVALSPDGQTALSGSADRTLVMWDLERGEVLKSFGGFRGSPFDIVFTPDGKTALIGFMDGSLRILDLENEGELHRFLHSPPVVSAVFTPDGERALWTSTEGELVLWDLGSGKEIHRFRLKPDDTHGQSVTALAISPDGLYALSGMVDGSLALWNLENGEQIYCLGGAVQSSERSPPIEWVAFTPDGRQALTSNSDGEVILWDPHNGKEIRNFIRTTSTDKIYRFAINPNSATALLGKADGGLILWDLGSGEEIQRYGGTGSPQGHTGWVSSIAISADGRNAISSSTDGSVILWDIESGQEIQRLAESVTLGKAVYSISVHPQGHSALVGSEDGLLIHWDLDDEENSHYLGKLIANVESVEVSPDGQTALVVSADGILTLFDLANGGEIRKITGSPGGAVRLALLPDGHTVISTYSPSVLYPTSTLFPQTTLKQARQVYLWDISSGEIVRPLDGHESDAYSIAVSPDGRVALSGGLNGELILWNLQSGEVINRLVGGTSFILRLAFSPDGHTAITSSDDSTLILWELETGEEIRRFPIELNAESLAFSPNGDTVLAGLTGGELVQWDIHTGAEIQRLSGHAGILWSIAISDDGRRVLTSAQDGSLRLWDLTPGAEIDRLVQPEGYFIGAAFSPDGKTALSGLGNHLILWDLDSGQVIQQLEGHEQPVFSVAISMDSRFALSSAGNPILGDDTSLILWDLSTYQEIRRLEGEDQIFNIVFTPDGRYAVAGTEPGGDFPALILWDLETGNLSYPFALGSEVHDALGVAISPDGRNILSGSFLDGMIRLWDLETGEELRRFPGHHGGVSSISFGPEGQLAVSASWDRSMILWDTETTDIVRYFSGRTADLFSQP